MPQITADFAKVIGVVDNLLSNAVKFTPMGGRINVKAGHILPSEGRSEAASFGGAEEKEESGYIYVSVEDSGIGIKRRIRIGYLMSLSRQTVHIQRSIRALALALPLPKVY